MCAMVSRCEFPIFPHHIHQIDGNSRNGISSAVIVMVMIRPEEEEETDEFVLTKGKGLL